MQCLNFRVQADGKVEPFILLPLENTYEYINSLFGIRKRNCEELLRLCSAIICSLFYGLYFEWLKRFFLIIITSFIILLDYLFDRAIAMLCPYYWCFLDLIVLIGEKDHFTLFSLRHSWWLVNRFTWSYLRFRNLIKWLPLSINCLLPGDCYLLSRHYNF